VEIVIAEIPIALLVVLLDDRHNTTPCLDPHAQSKKALSQGDR
jgi:hypothetical protein